MDEPDASSPPDVVILGIGDLTQPILDALDDDHEVAVVTEDPAVSKLVRDDLAVLDGDPSDDRVLSDAGVGSCRVVIVATETDRFDALAILSARDIAPSVRIVAAATNRENVAKLERAGADAVISPASIGSRILVDSALKPESGRDEGR
ncbi:NAD(P)-binding protein [Halorubrum sp. DTA98]|uniref:NAD(P)-binding protein n=1 Tax=Halorubrum sp. DTA98 TaxID=3402163 RepID=UPI003AACC123